MSATPTPDLSARYAAPTTAIVTEPADTPLRRRRVIVMLLLTIVTLGNYPAIWYLRRWRALNGLDSPRKLVPWPACGQLAIAAFDLVYTVVMDQPATGPLIFVLRYGFRAWMLFEYFGIRTILDDHLTPPPEAGDPGYYRDGVSGVATFFLSPFYLQYVINRDVLGPSDRR